MSEKFAHEDDRAWAAISRLQELATVFEDEDEALADQIEAIADMASFPDSRSELIIAAILGENGE